MCSGRMNRSCPTCDTRRVTVRRHEYHMMWKSCWTPLYVNKTWTLQNKWEESNIVFTRTSQHGTKNLKTTWTTWTTRTPLNYGFFPNYMFHLSTMFTWKPFSIRSSLVWYVSETNLCSDVNNKTFLETLQKSELPSHEVVMRFRSWIVSQTYSYYR